MEKQLYLTQPNSAFHQQHINASKLFKKSTLYTTKSLPRTQNTLSNKYHKINNFNTQEYYHNKSIKPGFHTLKAILNTQYHKVYNDNTNNQTLQINLPLCIALIQNQYCIVHTKNQSLSAILDVNYFNYKQKLDKYLPISENQPLFIHCTTDGNLTSKKILMPQDFTFSSFPKTESSYLMQYIMPYSKYANLLRLFFIPKGNRIFKKSYAFKMVNKAKLDQYICAKKSKMHHYFFVQQKKEDSYNISLLKGKSLHQFQQMSQKLVQHLEKMYQVVINQIVIDFIVDKDKKPWIYEIKDVTMTQNSSIWASSNPEQIQIFTKKQRQYLQCSLCKCNFVKKQMQHIVTEKLIYEFLTHLQLRGKNFIRQIDANIFRKHNQNLKVCQLCYKLIVAQHELINTQKVFCKFVNFKLDQIACQKIDTRQKKLQQDYILYQWRMMVYVQRCKDTPIKYNFLPTNSELHLLCREKKDILKCPFKDQNDQLLKSKIKRQTKINLNKSVNKGKQSQKRTKYTSMNTSQTIFENNFQQYVDKQNIEIDAIKIYTFYSKGQSIAKFLQNTKIHFSLNVSNNKFQGSCTSLQALYNKPKCQRISSQIFLFDGKLKHCSLQVTVGLVCDGIVSPHQIGNLNQQFIDDILFSPKGIKLCEALPDQWIECFFDGKVPKSQNQIQKICKNAMDIMGIIASNQ